SRNVNRRLTRRHRMRRYQFIPASRFGCNSSLSEAQGGSAIALVGAGSAIALVGVWSAIALVGVGNAIAYKSSLT
ncbi:MAG: hypothetical protein ICV54_26440, partial [Nostoc sp. C3-bin3]|nr:hypothetical protein [Nostoc sp. C3-bin3]